MTVVLDRSVVTSPSASNTGIEGVDHLVCCDPNVARCGLDVSGVPWGSEFDSDCPLCEALYEAGPCGRRFCRARRAFRWVWGWPG